MSDDFKNKNKLSEGNILISTSNTKHRKEGDFIKISYNAGKLVGYEYGKSIFGEGWECKLIKDTRFPSQSELESYFTGVLNIKTKQL